MTNATTLGRRTSALVAAGIGYSLLFPGGPRAINAVDLGAPVIAALSLATLILAIFSGTEHSRAEEHRSTLRA